VLVVAALLTVATLTGCVVHTPPPAPKDWSGFLDDYSRLRLGDSGDLPFVYRNPKANWTGYDAVLIEPVALWRSGKHALDPIPEADLLHLVAHFEHAVRARLGKGFRVVREPGPRTLRLRLAITEARATDPVVDVMTATPEDDKPVTGALSPELAAFIDAAAIEGEVRDAVSGDILAQGIDSRQKGARTKIATWEGLDRALAFWADQACSRLEARVQKR
jgi:hypothetical protein